MPKLLQETGRITEAAVAQAKDTGRMPVQLVSPGHGSSGYYSAEVLEQAVADGLFPVGQHNYADHPTAEETKARPVRSIKDLVSVSVTEGRIATDDDVATWGADPGAIVADVDVLPTYRPLIEHFSGAIGLSIRGDGELVEGVIDGKPTKIVESLAHVQSTDWVTRAGRGGRVLSLVESARANSRAIEHGLSESTVNDTREALQNVLRDAHGGEKTYVWVRDFDDSTVWFEVENGDDSGVFGQTYTEDEGVVVVTGERTEVRVVTKYVPATRPDSTTPTTESQKETLMGTKQIEEAEFDRLSEAAGRVATLESENATKDARIKDLEEADATRVRTDRATAIVVAEAKTAEVDFTAREVKGFLADVTLTEAGELDEAAFTQLVKEEAATKKAGTGTGTVLGLGGAPITESGGGKSLLAQIDEALGLETTRIGQEA